MRRPQVFPLRPAEVTLEASDSQSVWDDPDAYRIFHAMRFFGSLRGFYTGELDLTGRHLQRFNELLVVYNQLKNDFDAIRSTVRVEEYQDTDSNGKLGTFARYVMTDEDSWKRCRLKWKLPRVVDFRWLEFHFDDLEIDIQKAQGEPKIQQLTIMDLPVELLDRIFHFADERQAGFLASTCKTLKNIGRPYLHHTRTLTLRFADSYKQVEEMKLTGPTKEALDELARERSRELISLADHLASRPAIADATRELTVTNNWKIGSFQIPSFQPYWSDKNIFDPCAYIDDAAVEDDILEGRTPSCPQVLNVHLNEAPMLNEEQPPREASGEGLCFALLLFPNLITLSHHAIRDPGATWLPSPEIQDRSDHFCDGLRRLSFNLFLSAVPMLTGWIGSCRLRTLAPCTLTHLKLRTSHSLPDNRAIALLESLQSAPLEVLVLDGIREGSLTLLERIAQLFPDLLGLTLILRRSSGTSLRTKARPWPYASWEYASRLRGFRELEYFTWNFRSPGEGVTPFALLGFEAAAEGASWEWPSDVDDEFDPEDHSSIAILFACHCPTLEIFVLETEDGPDRSTFVRGDDGGINAKSICLMDELMDKYDQQCYFFHDRAWEPVLPVAG
ncbi:hypothetical protein V5O48_014621 [Marasmius crinis-equi]|uniref:F-box domain-containing protein n=1 Tax=Marasmius crinis-equi TaxID=585013 RepID=A0ABR3EWT3_9AGAR